MTQDSWEPPPPRDSITFPHSSTLGTQPLALGTLGRHLDYIQSKETQTGSLASRVFFYPFNGHFLNLCQRPGMNKS
jgi:hypothetical protein